MHNQPNTIGHPSTNPVTQFQVQLTFRLQPEAYDPEYVSTPVQQQADIMAAAVLDLVREALGEQSDSLLDLVEISARGVV